MQIICKAYQILQLIRLTESLCQKQGLLAFDKFFIMKNFIAVCVINNFWASFSFLVPLSLSNLISFISHSSRQFWVFWHLCQFGFDEEGLNQWNIVFYHCYFVFGIDFPSEWLFFSTKFGIDHLQFCFRELKSICISFC